jgi:hypothetical protein
LTIGYKKGIIAAEISFNQRGAMGANFQANGENWQFRASRDLANLFFNDKGGLDLTGYGDLWGNYTFQVLEGITIEAAVNKESSQWEQGYDSWTHQDRFGKNYLLINAKPMAGLEVGVKIPNLFQIDRNNTGVFDLDLTTILSDAQALDATLTSLTAAQLLAIPANDPRLNPTSGTYIAGLAEAIEAYKYAALYNGRYNFMDDSLRRMVFGVKYSVAPITVAFQFGLNGYGLSYATPGIGGTFNGNSNRIYFGAKYDIAPGIDAGVYFRGDFGFKAYSTRGNDATPKTGDDVKQIDDAQIVFGGSFNYASGPLGAGLTFRFTDPSTAATADAPKHLQNQVFQVGLSARYDVLPDNLRVKMDFELQFPILGEEVAKGYEKGAARLDQPRYTFTPQIIYNFLGTGAGDDPGVGMRIKYRVQGRFLQEGNQQAQNELTFAFKWSF